MTGKRRKLHLNAFLMEAGHHEASWRRPDSNPRADFDLDHWIGLARLAESAKFDSLFLADGPAITGTGEFRPPGQLEPLTLLTALASILTGDTLMFLMGRYTGWWLLGLLCRLSLNPEACILRSADSFYKRGRALLIFAKFVPGINTIAPPMAGSMNMRYL